MIIDLSRGNETTLDNAISRILDIYRNCCEDEILSIKKAINAGKGVWLIEHTLKESFLISEDVNLNLLRAGRMIWLLSYLMGNKQSVLIDWLCFVIDSNKNNKGVNATYSQINIISYCVQKGYLTVEDLDKLVERKIHEDFVYGDRGSTKSLQHAVVKVKDDIKKLNYFPQTLIELFEYQSRYFKVMSKLVDKEWVERSTFIWKYKKKGYKQLVCALLKDMEFKGYFKDGVSLSWGLCKIISSNTFNVQIQSNRTFYDGNLSPNEQDIIPFASTIDK